MSQEPVSITGIGLVCAIGQRWAELSEHLRELRHGFERHSLIEGDRCPARVFGTIPGYDFPSPRYLTWRYPEHLTIPRELLRSLPPHGVYAFGALEEALGQAGLDRATLGDGRTGLTCASAGSPWLLTHELRQLAACRGQRGNPMGVACSISGSLNFNFGAYLGIRGINCGFTSACASSAHALVYALDALRSGQQDAMIVLAGEDLKAETLLPFLGMRALSTHPDPDTASRPFDVQRSGFVGSGGGTCLILETQARIEARGARPLATLRGWGQSADGHSVMASHPEGEGLLRAMQAALADAGLPASAIDHVSAHATGTQAGDLSEALALRQLFLAQGLHPAISSTKALTGHTLSMSGALQAALAVLAIAEGFTPGAAHLETPDPAFADLFFPRTSLPKAPQAVLSNSSGFGGSNVSLVLTPPH